MVIVNTQSSNNRTLYGTIVLATEYVATMRPEVFVFVTDITHS